MLFFLSLLLGENPGLPNRFQVDIENIRDVQQLLAEIADHYKESEAKQREAESEHRRRVEEERLGREREEEQRKRVMEEERLRRERR